MSTVKINGKEITVDDGTLILDAARMAGFEIPTMCYHARLSKLASCRVCLVEIVGQKKLQPSCVTPVMHNMEVLTESPVVKSARSSMIELLLANHPLDCPVCDKGGECELQDVTFKFGPRNSPFAEWKRRFNEEDYILSPVIVQNTNRCIQCKRCVRICAEVVGAGVLGSIGRGAETEETSFVKGYLDCDHCGNCIEVCPVGSLMSRPYRYKSRPWDLKGVDTVCTYCGTGCQLTVQARDGEVLRVISKPDSGINNETLCARGRFGYSFINSHERLVTPMVRVNGVLEPSTWDEAIKVIRQGLTGAIKIGEKIGGIASSRFTNEELYLFQKLMRVALKTNNIDSSSRWHTGTVRDYVDIMGLKNGGVSIYDALKADSLLIIGSGISDENPVTDYIIRRLSSYRKMNIIIVSPRGLRLDSSAAVSIRHRPGTEAEVIGEISKVIEKSKDVSKDKIASVTSADWGGTGSAAELIKTSNSVSIAVGNDLLRTPLQLSFLKTFVELLKGLGKDVRLFPVLDRANQRGAWDMGVHPGILPGYRHTDEEGLGCDGIIEAALKGEVGALYVAGEDIISDFPDGGAAKEALSKVKFLIVQDIFLTGTAKMANVVLPGASFVEKEGTFTNQEGRVQRLRRLYKPHGDVKADWEIFVLVGEAVGHSFHFGSVSEVFEEIREVAPMYREINFYGLNGDGAILQAAGSADLYGRLNKSTSTPPSPTLEKGGVFQKGAGNSGGGEDPEYPFTLITGNHLYHSGRLSLKADTLRDILSEAIVEISEEDANDLRINEGDKVRVKGKRYEAALTAKINKGSMRGVVFIPENFDDVHVNMFFTKGEGYPKVRVIHPHPIPPPYRGREKGRG
ncbi:MAG: NADH-quinone oxidoreductase subunit NuoG [Nitrospirae bacterium]|nr:NADH-quinone oxidoreductase subunit NuoG [Nitrospirota bacterium]